jgi:membrane protein YqaA with SNARE-associated domain
MFESLRTMIHAISDWTLAWAQTDMAEVALFVIALAESSFFPIPPDLLLITMAAAKPVGALYFAALCTIGSVLGGGLGYGLGMWAGRPFVESFFSAERIQKVETLFHRYHVGAIALAAFTPIPYKVFTLAGGVFRIPFVPFMLVSLVGRGARFFIIGFLFYFWGDSIRTWIEAHLEWLTLGLSASLLALIFGYKIWSGRRKSLS